jgi:hypothetical protein
MIVIKVVACFVLGLPILTFATMFSLHLAGGTDDNFIRAFYYSCGVITGYVICVLNNRPNADHTPATRKR